MKLDGSQLKMVDWKDQEPDQMWMQAYFHSIKQRYVNHGCHAVVMLGLILLVVSCGSGSSSSPSSNNTPTSANPNNETNIPGWYYSNNLRSSRYIYLHLPDSYETGTDRSYPTVYLLDANWYFDGSHDRIAGGGIVEVIDDLVASGLVPEMIVVGIGNLDDYGNQMRGNDFHSGNTPQFLQFITDELIPMVDEKYNSATSPVSVLIGHSSGGYFSTYALFQNQTDGSNPIDYFISLSIWNGHGYADIFLEEIGFGERVDWNQDLGMRFFMGVGENEEDRFLTVHDELLVILMSRGYPGFLVQGTTYLGHDHSSYIPIAVKDGLEFVFIE